MDCGITENYFKEKARMTKRENALCCGISCRDCPLYRTNSGDDYGCGDLQNIHPDKAIAIVQKWSDEHKQKTYKDDFFEKFPNAFKNTLGEPMYCRKNLYEGADSNECHRSGCTDCWNEIMEVTK